MIGKLGILAFTNIGPVRLVHEQFFLVLLWSLGFTKKYSYSNSFQIDLIF